MCLCPSATMPSLRAADLRRALASVEVPECDCRITLVPVCRRNGGRGCDRQQRHGKCRCPRWPNAVACSCPKADKRGCKSGQCPPCPHLESHATRMRMHAGFLTLAKWAQQAPEDAWATLLWATDPKHYADRPTASQGATATTQEARVALRELRKSLRLSLWHREDVLCPGDETRRQQAAERFLTTLGRTHR